MRQWLATDSYQPRAAAEETTRPADPGAAVYEAPSDEEDEEPQQQQPQQQRRAAAPKTWFRSLPQREAYLFLLLQLHASVASWFRQSQPAVSTRLTAQEVPVDQVLDSCSKVFRQVCHLPDQLTTAASSQQAQRLHSKSSALVEKAQTL